MITNLLSLQSNAISSNEGKAALEESQLRIHSVSLLHRMLYDYDELIMNSVKHVDKSIQLKIEVNISYEPHFTLFYKDNGQGVPSEHWDNMHSFGNRLIKIQSAQLHGKYVIKAEKGFNFSLEFS